MNDLTGHLLVAIPELSDRNFFRSVVLLIHHGEDGASGVVLNRPSNHLVKDIWEEVAGHSTDCDHPIHIGGPVDGPMIALHQSPDLAEVQVVEGVYLSMDCEKINELVEEASASLRLYSGYSGWGPGQLDGEMRQGGWLALPATKDHVFSDDEALWKNVCHQIGNDILVPSNQRSSSYNPDCN